MTAVLSPPLELRSHLLVISYTLIKVGSPFQATRGRFVHHQHNTTSTIFAARMPSSNDEDMIERMWLNSGDISQLGSYGGGRNHRENP